VRLWNAAVPAFLAQARNLRPISGFWCNSGLYFEGDLTESDGLDLFLIDKPQSLTNVVTYLSYRLVQDSGPDTEGYRKRLRLAEFDGLDLFLMYYSQSL